jgi:Asp-tRNA(Asn)/Glu-tRNA(Gln) amidotransferase B subunit
MGGATMVTKDSITKTEAMTLIIQMMENKKSFEKSIDKIVEEYLQNFNAIADQVSERKVVHNITGIEYLPELDEEVLHRL